MACFKYSSFINNYLKLVCFHTSQITTVCTGSDDKAAMFIQNQNLVNSPSNNCTKGKGGGGGHVRQKPIKLSFHNTKL